MNVHDAIRLVEAGGVIWLTRHEAAIHARRSVRTIDRWLKEGLEHSGGGKGRTLLIRVDKLDEYIETL